MTTVTQADREAAVTYARNFLRWNGYLRDSVRLGQKDSHPLVQAFARHRIAAEQAGAKAMQERAKRIIEKRMDDRFEEYGTREPDTNATYYEGRRGETLEELDEEDFDDEDDSDDRMMECGYVPGSGVCMLAGTEHCDWECPFNPCDPL